MSDESSADPTKVELEAHIYRQIRHLGSHLRVQVKSDVITLSGSTEDYENKRKIYDLVKGLAGVLEVSNQIVVSQNKENVFDNYR